MDKFVITGIDIGQDSLKAVTLKSSGQQYFLLGYKEIPLVEGMVGSNHTIKQDAFVQVLQKLKKDLPRFSKQVAISVPDSAVISKSLQIEGGLEQSEEEFAVFQAFSHQSPFPIEELHLDYVEAAQLNRPGLNDKNIQVFATRKEVVDSRTDALDSSKLETVLVDMHSHGLGRVWQLATHTFPDKAKYALVEVGGQHSSFTMFTESGEFFHKEFICGSNSNSMGFLDSSSPEGGSSDGYAQQLAERVKRQLQLYSSINGSQDVNGIWLSGNGLDMSFIAEILSERLGIRCEVLNPLSLFEMKVSKKKRQPADWSHFTAAAGLAISGIQWLGGDNAVSS